MGIHGVSKQDVYTNTNKRAQNVLKLEAAMSATGQVSIQNSAGEFAGSWNLQHVQHQVQLFNEHSEQQTLALDIAQRAILRERHFFHDNRVWCT